MNVIKAIYNFLVGDIIILIGIILVFLVFALFQFVAALAFLRPYMGAILIVAILVVLGLTLNRELRSKKRKMA
ncbi:hypothetical protein [Tengunoibacter tsumagoiensis]|uniref:Uncharacterized protein n=1 Tax=Tengunoibacter tsumagoiensis TaxID=2014871 RepID=A0A402A8D9_9CHLR|nr:hypothetical protein [Tengunoibacter tsumagoiensis]GCE15231.1 hypothetical protein KTT_50900 [Tengunoibacter tsumagoiensis]